MKLTDVLFPLLLVGCMKLSIVGTSANNKYTIVADDRPHFGIQHAHKIKGRHPSHIVAFKNNDANIGRDIHQRYERKGGENGVKTSARPNVPVFTTQLAPLPAPVRPTTITSDGKNGKAHDDKNGTKSSGGGSDENTFALPSGSDIMDMKTVSLVLIGVTFFVIGCFVLKLVRSRSRRKTKKYGVLATHGSEVELTPLDQEDDDEDMTVFDANSR